jgi:hypothetical protein
MDRLDPLAFCLRFRNAEGYRNLVAIKELCRFVTAQMCAPPSEKSHREDASSRGHYNAVNFTSIVRQSRIECKPEKAAAGTQHEN